MSSDGAGEMAKVQRRIALKTYRSYRTVSDDAIQVISHVPPLDFQASERKYIFKHQNLEDHQISPTLVG